jgi:septation ring formation regulator EzrA
MATEGALQQLQDQGLDVFGALGESLSRVTGRAYTTEEAIRAIRRGAVSSAQAIEAIDAASNSPKAREAAQRFYGSFEGQVARLKTTMEDTFREISKMFLEAFDWAAVTAALRGGFTAIREIVKEIADTFLPVIDPKDKVGGIEKSFKGARDVALDIAESLVYAAKLVVESFKNIPGIIEGFQKAADAIKSAAETMNPKNAAVGGNLAAGMLRGKIGQLNVGGQEGQQGPEFGDGAMAMLKKIRERAAIRDAEQAKKLDLGNMFKLDGVWGTLKDGAKALADQVKQAAAKMQMAKVTFEKMALDLEADFASPAEKFNKAMEDVGNQLKDARARLAKGDPLLARIEGGLKRKAGAQIMDLLKENEVGTSWQATRADKGSAAAMETILRNRFGDQGRDVQERIKGALDLANRLAKAQLDAQERAVAAFENARPGVLAFK